MVIRVTDLRNGQGDYKALDDRMLVLDFQAGHPEAFVEIHRRYSGLARHVCQRFLPNAHDADEALQETMIRVFQGLYRFNGRYALQPWIGRIATNVSLDAIRTRTRRPLVDDEALDRVERVDPAAGPEEAVERFIERDLVLSVLSGLPESHRTALVLRELEGRSHREIAEVMDMSPSQAKALIHRAKGSFRRRWLLAVTEKGGLAGFALLPLMWALRVANLARRTADRVAHVGQVAQVATPEIVSSAASSPVIAVGGSSIGERVVAAGVTLLVAGSVTVGAATIARDRGERVDRAESPPAIIEVAPPRERLPLVVPPAEDKDDREDRGTHVVPVVVEPSPTVAPSPEPTDPPSPTPTPSPDPSPDPEPSPDPSVGPPAPPPPAPAWAGSFAVGWTSDDQCGCGIGVSLVSSTTKGDLRDPGGSLDVDQSIRGAARDAEGDPAWLVTADLATTLTHSGGSLTIWFSLQDRGVETRFVATAPVVDVAGDLGKGASVVYTFAGDYALVGAGEDSPIRTSGSVWAQIVVWPDGTTPILTRISLIP